MTEIELKPASIVLLFGGNKALSNPTTALNQNDNIKIQADMSTPANSDGSVGFRVCFAC